jgi:hypothetical protein
MQTYRTLLTTNTLMAAFEGEPLCPNLNRGTLRLFFSLDYECVYLSPALSFIFVGTITPRCTVPVRVPWVGTRGSSPSPCGTGFIPGTNTKWPGHEWEWKTLTIQSMKGNSFLPPRVLSVFCSRSTHRASVHFIVLSHWLQHITSLFFRGRKEWSCLELMDQYGLF